MTHKHKKLHKRHQATRPKKRKKKNGVGGAGESIDMRQMDQGMDTFRRYVMNKPQIQSDIKALIEEVISIFKAYDRVQLLGGLGLILIDNLPISDKLFEAQMSGTTPELDEDAEAILEYAMNFGTSIETVSAVPPTHDIIQDLYGRLHQLMYLYNLYDMPASHKDYEAWLTWVVHANHIHVRGDAYPIHMEQVYEELFRPHDTFFRNRFGFGFDTLKRCCLEIERMILSKIATTEGAYFAWLRWKEDSEKTYGTGEDAIEKMLADKPENGIFGSMINRSPDMFGKDATHVLVYQPDDFGSSDKIFWVVPQNDEEKALYEKLSWGFGDNAPFIAEGEFKGNFMSGMNLYRKPLVKVGEKYYCFTPMIPHRNMISLAEALLKEDEAYYDQHYRNNTDPDSRDQYMERKVAECMTRLLPKATIYHSVKYKTEDEGKQVNTELDVLCITEKANYVIEVKGHELTNADKVKIKGFKDKFSDSVGYGCHQANRAENHILNEDGSFTVKGKRIDVDRTLPIIKMVVTLQHFSAVIGHFKYMVGCGLLKPEYWNVWPVSLYDLMVVTENIENEQSFIDYMEVHARIQKLEIEYNDELDLFGRFLQGTIENDIKKRPQMIVGGSEIFDAKYSGHLDILKINHI